jgi:acetylornithine deacetylase
MNTAPVIQTLAGLVRINSVNPAYPDGRPEADIAAFIRQFFTERGIESWEQEVFPGRPNVIARLAGRDPARRVVFEAHADTASAEGMSIPPFEPALRDGRLYGRGSCDTKAGLAAMMHALASLKQAGEVPPCEIWVVAAADEEYSYRGVVKLCEELKAAAGVVSEPTGMRLVIASKGCLRWKIRTRGKAAHSSKPHLGVNAIAHMARVVLALVADAEKLAAVSHPLVHQPTLSIGTIEGGRQVNIVPDSCAIEIDRRLIPGEKPAQVLEHYQRLLAGLQAADPELKATMEAPMLEDVPLETPAHSQVAQVSSQVLQDIGLNPEFAGVPFGSDASKLSGAGIPSILLGPGSIDQAHAAVEYVDCEQVEQAFAFYRRFMLLFPGEE